jgi:hypothetical protein
MHADPSRVENSAQGSSCQLKFVHASTEKTHTVNFWDKQKFFALKATMKATVIVQSAEFSHFGDSSKEACRNRLTVKILRQMRRHDIQHNNIQFGYWVVI